MQAKKRKNPSVNSLEIPISCCNGVGADIGGWLQSAA